jgi:hypothetical protein
MVSVQVASVDTAAAPQQLSTSSSIKGVHLESSKKALEQLKELAVSIARKVLGRELEFAPEGVVDLIKQALSEKARQRREIYLRVNPADLQGKLILPLDAALKKEVEKLKFIAERNPNAPFMREVSVIGDRRISYELLSSVLYTAGQNELENFRFIVISKADD